MGIRGPTYIAIAPEAKPDLTAGWLKAIDARIQQDARGTLVLFEANLCPLWARISAGPGLARTSDLELEIEMVVWLGLIGTDHFRLARSEELLDIAGSWDASAFMTDPEVRVIEQDILEELGADYTAPMFTRSTAQPCATHSPN